MSTIPDTPEEMKDNSSPYSPAVIDHAVHPRNMGIIDDADGYAKVTGPCGDTMEVWLNAGKNIITVISFLTDGCGTSIASGSMMTCLAKGKSMSEALKLSQNDVLQALGGLPQDSEHCALLAVNTLKTAIRDCIEILRNPWKKLYRKY